MSDLPWGWAETTIGEICHLVNGKAFKPSDWTAAGLPIVRIQNLNRPESKFNHFDGNVEPHFLVENGDLLFAWSGTPGTSFGAHIWRGPTAVLNQHIFNVRFDRELIDPIFLRYAINQTLDEQIAKAHGGVGLRHVTKGKFERTVIGLPPLAAQRRIVAKIDSLTGNSKRAHEHLDHIPRLVEKYKQAILTTAFRGDLTREWRVARGSLPWKSVSVEEVASSLFDGPFGSNLKSNDYTDAGVRVVRLENIGHLRFFAEKETYISEGKYRRLQRHTLAPRDVLVSSFVAEEMRVCVVPEDLPTKAINKADCFCIRADAQICSPEFLAFRLASKETYSALEGAVHGATRPRISLTQLRTFRFDLPSLEEQNEIANRITSAYAWIDRLAYETHSARKLIDHLDQAMLAKAFRGELVPQDPNDEPARVLLDRIKMRRGDATSVRRRKH
ncbi:restriction endonuclease subunit S, partial [Sinorhizobium meliloti]|uniref:restriction endonuclease subunit S n=1 Tax=Rhizobium meliloti TaxID=382 RepID=UPI003D652BEE